MSFTDLARKLEESIKAGKCASKGCLSGNKDSLEIAWFGKQYEQKTITCSSCYVMNDEAVKKSLPTQHNILPVSAFINKFVAELKAYEESKSSPKWLPTDLRERQKEHLTELDNFEFKLTGTLKSLAQSLENFTKKVVQQNQAIYNNETFNEIIGLYSSNQMEQSLGKIQTLIQYLNCSQDDKYRFDDIEYRAKRNEKLAVRIEEVTKKVTMVLEELLVQIQDKNSAISKI